MSKKVYVSLSWVYIKVKKKKTHQQKLTKPDQLFQCVNLPKVRTFAFEMKLFGLTPPNVDEVQGFTQS